MQQNDLKGAFSPIPDDCYQALMSAAHSVKEDEKVKRKSYLIPALSAILVLVCGVAFAISSIRDTGRSIIEVEKVQGSYEDWTTEARVKLTLELMEQGYIDKTPELESLAGGNLSPEAAQKIADDAMCAFTGEPIEEISFMIVMQAAWGPFVEWSLEEQAWYSQLMVDTDLQGSDHTQYMSPEGELDQDAAVALARSEIAKGYEIDESLLDTCKLTVSFQIPEFAEPGDKQAYWYVEYEAPADGTLPFGSFWVFIHPDTGKFIETVPEIIEQRRVQDEFANRYNSDPLIKEIQAFEDTASHPNPVFMTLEERAQWSEKFALRILEKQKEEPEFISPGTQAIASFLYGLPDEKALTREAAREKAIAVLADTHGLSETEIGLYADNYRNNVFYDVTNPEKPLWKFVFDTPSPYTRDDDYNDRYIAYYGKDFEQRPNYKVELDAYTGETVNTFPYPNASDNTVEYYIQQY